MFTFFSGELSNQSQNIQNIWTKVGVLTIDCKYHHLLPDLSKIFKIYFWVCEYTRYRRMRSVDYETDPGGHFLITKLNFWCHLIFSTTLDLISPDIWVLDTGGRRVISNIMNVPKTAVHLFALLFTPLLSFSQLLMYLT